MVHGPAYSDGELEVQYNNQRRVPEYPAIAEDWARRSETMRRTVEVRTDLAYGDGARDRLDLYRCARPRAPLLAYVHGGYWQRGDKSVYGFIAEGPLEAGFDVAVLNYGLCPTASFASITPQVARALVWLLTDGASAHAYDPTRLFLCGHSAGGHLTAAMAATDFSRLARGLAPCPFSGVMPVSGVFELAPLIPTSINAALGLDPALAELESPLRRAPAAGACPVVAAVGGAESDEFRRQSQALVDAWAGAAPTRYLEVPGRNHFTVLEALARRDGVLCAALEGMLGDATR